MFGSFITELATRNPTMGTTTLEDGLFANLLIFDYLHVFRDFWGFFCKGKGREGKGQGKGKGKGKGQMERKIVSR